MDKQITVTESRREAPVPGRWYPTGSVEHQWVGICGKCGTVKAAIDLELVRLPWGRGEVWACRNKGC
jgi:hypothetical protein